MGQGVSRQTVDLRGERQAQLDDVIELGQAFEQLAGVLILGELFDQAHGHGDVNQVLVAAFDDDAQGLQFGCHAGRVGRVVNDQGDAHLVFFVEQGALLSQRARLVHAAALEGQHEFFVDRAK